MPSWLGTISFLVGITIFLGSVVVYLRGSKDKGTIDTLERNNHALTDRVTLLEANEQRLTTRVEYLERENADLRAERPSADVLSEIRGDLSAYIHSQREHNGQVKTILAAMASTMGDRE